MRLPIENLSEIIDQRQCSEKMAVYDIADSREISYAELHAKSVHLAMVFNSVGVKKGDVVIVQHSKSLDVIVAAFALFKCGAIFAPVDVEIPENRLNNIIEQSAAKLVVSNSPLVKGFKGKWSSLDQLIESEPASKSGLNKVAVCSSDPAYVIFTSGSTGVPKGVVISHGAAIAFLGSAQSVAQYDSSSRFLNTSPFFFDASILDIYLTLYLGAQLYLLPKILFPSDLTRAIEHFGITDTLMVSSVLKLLVNRFSDAGKRNLNTLRSVWYGAEPCPVSVLRSVRQYCPKVRFLHGYGPTEATHTTLLYSCDNLDQENHEYLPLGEPLNTIDVLTVGEDGKPFFDQGVGELMIGGEQLMHGYMNDEVSTKKAFVEINNKRYYKSNDLVKRDEIGLLRFVGRKDNAIKVKGMLVHLDEVESTALSIAGIDYAYATHTNHALHGKLITLFLVVECVDNLAVDEDGVKGRLSDSLPTYMVPSVVKIVPSKTCRFLPSGKLDRKWLSEYGHQKAVVNP